MPDRDILLEVLDAAAHWHDRVQDRPDGTNTPAARFEADVAHERARMLPKSRMNLLATYVAQVPAHRDDEDLRARLLDVAGLCAAWIMEVDAR